MKRFSLSLAVLLAALLLQAKPVTQQEAQQKAIKFLSEKQGAAKTAKGMRLAKRQPAITTAASQGSADAAAYYVFNIDGDAGFVIVSGDDRTPAILGYADAGAFCEDSIPDNMRAWLKDYEVQMSWLDKSTQETTTMQPLSDAGPSPLVNGQSPRRTPTVRSSVAPLLTTTWNQDYPYNRLLLDTLKYSAQCHTGCVAAAMAQLLNYHAQLTGMPDTISADIAPYTTWSRHYEVEGVASGTPIDWENMQDDYSPWAAIVTEEQRIQADAVGQLMHFCGAALQADYTTTGTQADGWSVPSVLKKHFGYSEATTLAMRENYTLSQWNDMVYNELTQGRPVFFSGTSSGGGHAFIVDGFDGDEMFHINWGWGGHCNGYYQLGLANPSDKDGVGAGDSYDGFAMGQAAIIEAQPDNGEPIVAEGLRMTFEDISVEDDQIIFSAFNENVKTTAFELGVATIADDGTLTPFYSFSTANLPQYYGYRNLIITISANKNDKTDKIVLVSREEGTEQWFTPMNPENYYIECVSKNKVVTLTLIEPQPQLELVELRFEGTPKVNRKQKVEAVIKNIGDEYYGNVMLVTKSEDSVADTCTVGASIAKGQTQTLAMAFEPKQEGRYEVMLVACTKPYTIIATDSIDVAPSGKKSNNVNLKIDIAIANLNATRQTILGNKAHLVITVNNDTDVDYEGVFVPLLVEPGSFEYIEKSNYFDAHSTTVLEQDFDVMQGKRYIPLCITSIPGRKQVTETPVKAYGVEPAVTFYMADGTSYITQAYASIVVPDSVVAVDMRGNDVTTAVTPSGNQNCIYYLSDDAETPEGLTMNVVKGVHADSLRIYDMGLPLMPMFDFTADTVCYIRTFDKGLTAVRRDGKSTVAPAWTTICLPFDADRCLIEDSIQVEWMTLENDSSYNFWLMEFKGDEGGTLFFEPAEQLKAYTPYMLMVPASGLVGLLDMTGKPVTFCGRNAALRAVSASAVSSSKFKFVGTMDYVTDSIRAYSIDLDGTLCHRGTVTTEPYRSYIKAMSNVLTNNVAPISIAPAIEVEAEEPETMPGDVNGDGYVDVADIALIIDIMAGIGVNNSELARAADVNGDGYVDVADIASVIEIMSNSSRIL